MRSQLTQAVADVTHEQVQAGAQTLRHQASLMAGIAAGMLKGHRRPPAGTHAAGPPPKDERD